MSMATLLFALKNHQVIAEKFGAAGMPGAAAIGGILKTKRKLSNNRREQRRTGGGSAQLQQLSEIEECVAALVGADSRLATTRGVAEPTHASRHLAPEAQREALATAPATLEVLMTTGGEEEHETTEPEEMEEEDALNTHNIPETSASPVGPAAMSLFLNKEVVGPSGMQLAMPRRSLVLTQTPRRSGQCSQHTPNLANRIEGLTRLCEETVAINRKHLQAFVEFTRDFSCVSARQAEASQQTLMELRAQTQDTALHPKAP
uniref:uncharacterized protein n=1 Tax=Pristiophorus japonicus TaxID=55135 RepID=UPI00398E9065